MDGLEERLARVEKRLTDAAQKSGRVPSAIKLLAASKNQPAALLNDYAKSIAAHGRPVIFGESYLQDFLEKKEQLAAPFEVHLIGHLQSNKVKEAVRCFDLIESVDSEKLARALNQAAGAINKKQPVLLQVNVSNDEAKSGVLPAQALSLAGYLLGLENLRFRGLMTITRLYPEREEVRSDFRALRQLAQRIHDKYREELQAQGQSALELSMGMSEDFDIAVEEGATIVRIGTALFGER